MPESGVDDSGELQYPEKDTPQGSVLSPLLSNIFLHTVLDDWYVNEVKSTLKGRIFPVRFADDFIIGCEAKSDAHRVLELLEERFEKYALSLHPEKTKLLPFGKLARSVKVNKVTGTFNFFGFTFYWSKSRKEYWIMRNRMRENFTYGSVGGAPGNQCFYPERVARPLYLMRIL